MKIKTFLISSIFLLVQNVQLTGQVYEEMVRLNIDSIRQVINSMEGTEEIDMTLNLGALFLSAIGLMMVVVGILLS